MSPLHSMSAIERAHQRWDREAKALLDSFAEYGELCAEANRRCRESTLEAIALCDAILSTEAQK